MGSSENKKNVKKPKNEGKAKVISAAQYRKMQKEKLDEILPPLKKKIGWTLIGVAIACGGAVLVMNYYKTLGPEDKGAKNACVGVFLFWVMFVTRMIQSFIWGWGINSPLVTEEEKAAVEGLYEAATGAAATGKAKKKSS